MVKVLAFDPAGNWSEGKGTTGYAISTDGNPAHELGDIRAVNFSSKHSYWFDHKNLIEVHFPDYVVIESYRLFGHKAKEQSGSSLETPQLIGYLEMVCYEFEIPVFFQDPSTKSRHSDDILVKTGIIEKRTTKLYYRGELTNLHQRDALRHELYFKKYTLPKVVKQ